MHGLTSILQIFSVLKCYFFPSLYYINKNQSVELRRNTSSVPTGIYRCDIPTTAMINSTVTDSVYVGLYSTNEGYRVLHILTISLHLTPYIGDISILDSIILAINSDLDGGSPQFTLTCISTGGPATTVTWTRDSTTVTEGTETVLHNPETAQYTHTLTVTGRQVGLYTCTVSNNKPSSTSATFTVQGK